MILFFSISFFVVSHVVPNSTFNFSSLFIFLHCSFIASILSAFLFCFQSSLFHLFSFFMKYKGYAPNHANEYHDQSYQCNMQPLCPDMPLIDFKPLTYMSIFSMNANTLSNENVMQVWIFIPCCKCFLRRYECDFFMMQNAKFIHDDVNAPLWGYRCKSIFFLNAKCPLRVCHDANVPFWVCHDANAFYSMQMQFNQKFLFISKSRLFRSLRPKCFQNLFFFFQNAIYVYFGEA